jgi:hypothetical protein
MGNRAQGINSVMVLGFQTEFKVAAAAAAFIRMAFDSDQVRGSAPLIPDPVLGRGRDGADPLTDAKDVTGDVSVPAEPRTLGVWLKLFFGAPVSSVATLAASGTLKFRAQPAGNSTFALNGVVWTFVTAAPAGLQIQIGANLAATLTAAATALNASANAEVAKCTYVASADTLTITFDTLGKTGNTFTLTAQKATNARVSWPTLRGGAYKHTFHSGAVALPAATIEAGNPEIPSYRGKIGVMANTWRMNQSRQGRLVATIGCIGYDDRESTPTSIVGTEDVVEYEYSDVLVQKDGEFRIDGELAGDVTASDITMSNGLAIVPGVGNGGLISGIDVGEFTSLTNLTLKFSDEELLWKARNKVPMEITQRWAGRAGMSLAIIQHRVFLPEESPGVAGTGSLDIQFAAQAGRDLTLNRKVTVELVNDVEAYA